jgi:hypothetical protein
MTGQLRSFDRRLLKTSGSLERRVLEPEPHCWFCESTTNQRSREHVIPRWLQDYLQVSKQLIKPVRYLSDQVTIGSEWNEYTVENLVVGNICVQCNTGWMSKLEAEFKAHFVQNKRQRMTNEEAEIYAKWFVKTAICLNLSQPYRLLFPKELRLGLKYVTPASVKVFLFRTRKDNQEVNWKQTSHEMWTGTPELENLISRNAGLTYSGIIHIGKLNALVIYIPEELQSKLIEFETNLALIWPPTKLPTWGGIPYLNSFEDAHAILRVSNLD